MPTNFYIGEIGYGTCSDCGPCGGYACFNVHSANLAGAAYTYAYWGLEGPTLTPVGSTPYAWGRAQGNAAVDAWANGPYWPYLYTLTLFADIEAGFGGWIGATQADAQQVLNGFLDGIIANPYSYPLNAGVYINARDINGPNNYFFGPNYTPSQPFVFWPTGTVCGLSICDSATGGCVPCNPVCTPLSTVQNNWNTTIQNACWAGQGAVIWQFWISSCDNSVCAGDFDYTPQSGNTSFSNVACSGSPCLA
jgi:hypothetical protein